MYRMVLSLGFGKYLIMLFLLSKERGLFVCTLPVGGIIGFVIVTITKG